MKKEGFFRFFVVNIILTLIFSYNVSDFIKIKSANIIVTEKQEIIGEKHVYKNTVSTEFTEQKPETQKKDEETQNIESSNSESPLKEVLAGAYKGKVITKYISPYNAPSSYDNVYLKNSTELEINIKKLLNSNLDFKITSSSEPQVLIIHTHATETFLSEDVEYYTEDYISRSTDNNKNMVKIGRIIAEKLNEAGITTLHSDTHHDYPQYSGSYTRSAKTINEYLEKYPSIKIVLDLHRDAISAGEADKVKLVTQIGSKKAAQVMLVMGSQSGTVKNFPNWQENFKLALKLQQKMEEKYPTLARPLSLMSKNYNQSLTKGSLLIEFGTDANALEEVTYSAELVADCLTTLLNELKE